MATRSPGGGGSGPVSPGDAASNPSFVSHQDALPPPTLGEVGNGGPRSLLDDLSRFAMKFYGGLTL